MATKIFLKKDVKKDSLVIEGFPGTGFVGSIAAGYIISQLGMECIGYVRSDKIPSIVMIHDLKPCRSIRIYAKDDLIIIMSEFVVPPKIVPEISDALTGWFDTIKPRQVISLAGVSGKVAGGSERHTLFGISTDDDLNKKLEESGVTLVKEGAIAGISENLLIYCYENKISSLNLMVETQYVPNPMAAISVIEILNNLIGLSIPLDTLIKEGEQIEKLFNDLSDQLKKSVERYNKMENYSPMYT